jgi:hypothetical protein
MSLNMESEYFPFKTGCSYATSVVPQAPSIMQFTLNSIRRNACRNIKIAYEESFRMRLKLALVYAAL